MPTPPLGRLERVDLRAVWTSESGDFTPWLAHEDNLAVLGDTIGLDLELQAQEQRVGPFRADILCKDTLNDSYVLIENQLESTDHSHLGQLMTYAAGLDAATIVWIAESFTAEHRAAIDWLNRITEERFNFFALEIELWRIGDSPPAPKFNVVSQPNEWAKTVTESTRDSEAANLTETKLMQQEYWAGLREELLNRRSIVKPQKPRPQHWMNFAIGRTNTHMSAFCNTQDEYIGVNLNLTGPNSKSFFQQLADQKAEIEREMQVVLDWRELPGKQMSRIVLRRQSTDPNDRQAWPEQHEWLAEKLELFYRVFQSRVKGLTAEAQDEVPE